MLNDCSMSFMKTTDTRNIILEKTFRLLLEKGYDGVSISDIQQATGMARGLLYHYFGNKDALFVEVTQKYFLDLFQIDFDQICECDVRGVIDYITRKYDEIGLSTWADSSQGTPVHIINYDFLFYRVMKENDDFLKKYQQVREQEVQAWEIGLNRSFVKGELRSGIDLKKMARYFVFLADGVWMNAVSNERPDYLTRNLKKVLDDFYELLKN